VLAYPISYQLHAVAAVKNFFNNRSSTLLFLTLFLTIAMQRF